MPRKLTVLSFAPLIALALWVSQADSTIRINGNQMIEGSEYYNATTARSATHVATKSAARLMPVPTIVVHSLGQAMLPVGDLPGSSSGVRFGVGLAYDMGKVVYSVFACPVSLTGDINQSGALTSADIIGLVNFVFKGGSPPQPCTAAGDVNASGTVTSADIISMVNYVFKGGAAPQDVCPLIPGTWSCP